MLRFSSDSNIAVINSIDARASSRVTGNSEPASDDFKKVDAAYNRAVAEMKAAGATVIDVELPDALALLAKRASGPTEQVDSWNGYFGRNAKDSPFKSRDEMYSAENVAKVARNMFT